LRALIIGAAGFVGGHLVRQLSDSCGYDVFATKLPSEHISADNCTVCDLDIMDQDQISRVIAEVRPDQIYHLAAQSSVKVSWEKPQLTADINIRGTINLLEAVRSSGQDPRILLVGSAEEYGYVDPDDVPVDEDTVLRAGNIYAATKACQGMIGEIYARAYKMDIIMVRAFNHIGPGQSDIFVVSDFCRQAVNIALGRKEAVISVGNLSAQRDFTDVRDIVRAYSMLMSSGISGKVYNVGSGNARSIRYMLDEIIRLSGVSIEIRQDEKRMRPSDVPVIAADISRITADTGWKPEIPLDVTIRDTISYWRSIEE